MTVDRLKKLLENVDGDTEVVVTGSWQYSNIVPGSIKKYEGSLSIVIDAVDMKNRIELYAKLEEVR